MFSKVKLFKLFVWFFLNLMHLVESLEYERGICEALQFDMLITLITKKAGELLTLGNTPPHGPVQFDLYTRLNPYERQILQTYDQYALQTSNFNPAWPVRFSLHGWNGKSDICSQIDIKNAYLAKGDFNVILVDWSAYAIDIDYTQVVAEVVEIADKVTKFTRFLHWATSVPYADMYLIGHSLGAHVAATAGKLLKPDLYGAIFGLDPAGPLFYDLNMPTRLSPSDAMYVESIHTDIRYLGQSGTDMAHASFYLNWGLGQPHCPDETAMEPKLVCDHFSAVYFFAESIRNDMAFGAINCRNLFNIQQQACYCPFKGKNCKADVYMGGEPAFYKRGIYYLSTRFKQPYGYGQTCYIAPALTPTIERLDTIAQTVVEESGKFVSNLFNPNKVLKIG